MKRVFLAGIIQGSQPDKSIHSQDYRAHLKKVLADALNGYEIYCPVENHPDSVDYRNDQARSVFVDHVKMAAESDIVVAFLPQASMGTAIEVWDAYKAGRTIFTISPMTENWVVKLLTTRNFETLEQFEQFVAAGQITEYLKVS